MQRNFVEMAQDLHNHLERLTVVSQEKLKWQ